MNYLVLIYFYILLVSQHVPLYPVLHKHLSLTGVPPFEHELLLQVSDLVADPGHQRF